MHFGSVGCLGGQEGAEIVPPRGHAWGQCMCCLHFIGISSPDEPLEYWHHMKEHFGSCRLGNWGFWAGQKPETVETVKQWNFQTRKGGMILKSKLIYRIALLSYSLWADLLLILNLLSFLSIIGRSTMSALTQIPMGIALLIVPPVAKTVVMSFCVSMI